MTEQEQATPPQHTPGTGASGPSTAGYKRASRKNAPKKFVCDWPNCDKKYSRAEHLQRHQLNHDPREIFRCDVADCDQAFVRQDLLVRHKKRHSTSYVPRNRTSSFSFALKEASNSPSLSLPGIHGPPGSASTLPLGPAPQTPASRMTSIQEQQPLPSTFPPPPPPTNMPRNASVLLSPNTVHSSQTWSPSQSQSHPQSHPHPIEAMLPPITNPYHQPQTPLHDQSGFMTFPGLQVPAENIPPNFGLWLFDNQGHLDFNMSNMSFMDGGLESSFNNNIHYDHESLTSRSQVARTPDHHSDAADGAITEECRRKISLRISAFRDKHTNAKYDQNLGLLLHEPGSDVPGISPDFLYECLAHYWEIISPRLPIIHQPTFSPSRCRLPLLLVMIALGAAHMHNRSPEHKEYKALADLIITSIRLEILGEASPPVDLWAAQALLLIEFYEKMYSTRKLHERGHIYHSVTLNLLRRGSPLIGKAGLESPPDEQNGVEPGTDDREWWIRWAERESMHRVVYVAFMMDVVHAAMFGHSIDMGPHEIRLPLPCDKSLWSAQSVTDAHSEEQRLRMYGIRPVLFPDGLKRALHGLDVTTHSFGRMIIMCGLLCVGWHIRHQESQMLRLTHNQAPSDKAAKWCRMLLKAFDDWKRSFDDVTGPGALLDAELGTSGQACQANGLIQSATVLYHMAHISFYVNIIDCQVFAGAKRLLGRYVSSRDQGNVNTRMAEWAQKPITRQAVLHAFKLLQHILIDPRPKKIIAPGPSFGDNNSTTVTGNSIQYSVRTDPDPHRPWILYYAVLSIWSFAQAYRIHVVKAQAPQSPSWTRRERTAAEYLSRVAKLSTLDEITSGTLCDGLQELLDVVVSILSDSHSELLKEARVRLTSCKELMFGGGTTCT
ncbi:zinc finger protein zas1 [Xylariaceae sp. FL0594]|nr:zinc finger protein zas1 [Xylariaceae sp. FL0594]